MDIDQKGSRVTVGGKESVSQPSSRVWSIALFLAKGGGLGGRKDGIRKERKAIKVERTKQISNII